MKLALFYGGHSLSNLDIVSNYLFYCLLQNVVVFQVYAILSRGFDSNSMSEPPSYKNVALVGVGSSAHQSVMLSQVELVKICLQLQTSGNRRPDSICEGPVCIARNILKKEGVRDIYRGLSITVLRDAPAHGVYF